MLTPAKHTENQANKATAQSTPFFGSGGSVPFFQAKLTVNQPGDAHEQEADRVADQVMRMPAFDKSSAVGEQCDAPIVQRMPLTPVNSVMRACAECEKEKAQRKETGSGDASRKTAPSVVSDVLSSGGGQPMEGGTRQFMESRFRQDFSQVRIHTDSQAAASASAIQARAYTSGRDVVFGAGEYQPGSESGRRLLAHELVHVGQQNGVQQETVQREDDQAESAGRIQFSARGLLPITGFKIINSNDRPRFLPGPIIPNTWYPTDGFYKCGHRWRFFKIPNGCRVTVLPANWENPTVSSCWPFYGASWQNIEPDHYPREGEIFETACSGPNAARTG